MADSSTAAANARAISRHLMSAMHDWCKVCFIVSTITSVKCTLQRTHGRSPTRLGRCASQQPGWQAHPPARSSMERFSDAQKEVQQTQGQDCQQRRLHAGSPSAWGRRGRCHRLV